MSDAGRTRPRARVAVVGGGIIGLSVAWRLAQRGIQAVVFEKSTVGGEASWAGAGMLAPGGEVDGPSEWADLSIESRNLYSGFVRELREASGFAIDYQECGALELAYSAAEAKELNRRAAAQERAGIRSKAVSSGDIAKFWPRVRRENLAGGRFYPGDAIVNPREVMLALAAACRSLELEIRQECPVSRVRVAGDAVEVEAQGERERFDAAVIAAGAWSGGIAVEGVPAIPKAEPVKGHLIGYQQPAQTCSTIVRYGHAYALQRATGLLIVGSSTEHAGFDRELKPDVIAGLAERAGFLLPHLAETTPSETWAGFRPASDALQLGPWHSERLYLAYGHYRNGILLAPVTADRIAGQICARFGETSRETFSASS